MIERVGVRSHTLDSDSKDEGGEWNFSPDRKKDVTAVAENGWRVQKMREGGDAANAQGKL